MSSVIAAGGAGKERQKTSTKAAVMRATSTRDGAFSRPAHGGLRTQVTAALRRPAHRQLEEGIAAQRVAVVGIFISARDREHAEAQHRRKRVHHPFRIAPVLDAARQRLGQAEPAFGLAQQDQPAVRRDQPAREIGGHLLAACGWKIEREQGIFGHGGRGALAVSGEIRLATNFYPISTGYAMSAITSSRRAVESRTGAPALGSGGLSGAFAPGLSPAPVAAFPVPAHQTGRAGFPHPAFGRDHAFACGRPLVLGDRRVRPYSSRSLVSGKRTYFPVFTLCLRQSHRRSRRTACQSTAL